jgi:hypothetical protein
MTSTKRCASTVFGNGLNPASGGHLGYIPGGGLYASALADYLAAVSNKHTGIQHFPSGSRIASCWGCSRSRSCAFSGQREASGDDPNAAAHS